MPFNPRYVPMRVGVLVSLVPLVTSCGLVTQPGTSTPVSRPASMNTRVLENPTALQKHVMFFDANQDGKLTPGETRSGFRRLGVSPLGSLASAILIHAGMTRITESGGIDISRIAFSKHGSDTGIYDSHGHFVQAAFDRMWTFDTDRSGSLTWTELKVMMAANRTDTAGSLASRAEFGLLIRVGADTTATEMGQSVPALSRARLQAFYDGSLFYVMAEERESAKWAEPLVDALP